MNIAAKLPTKNLANQIQELIKKNHTPWSIWFPFGDSNLDQHTKVSVIQHINRGKTETT